MILAFVQNFTNPLCSTLARHTKALHKASLAKELQSHTRLFNIIHLIRKQKFQNLNIKKHSSKILIQFCIAQIESTADKPP